MVHQVQVVLAHQKKITAVQKRTVEIGRELVGGGHVSEVQLTNLSRRYTDKHGELNCTKTPEQFLT